MEILKQHFIMDRITCLILILQLFSMTSAIPIGNYIDDYSDSNPQMSNLLRFPLEVDLRESQISAITDSLAPWKQKRHHVPKPRNDSCCPTMVEIIEPVGGKSRSGDLVELYQTEDVRQQIYEVSCVPEYANKHCRFLDEFHTPRSKCVQQYSYTYALVRDFGNTHSSNAWRLDYIKVRSGCSCKVDSY